MTGNSRRRRANLPHISHSVASSNLLWQRGKQVLIAFAAVAAAMAARMKLLEKAMGSVEMWGTRGANLSATELVSSALHQCTGIILSAQVASIAKVLGVTCIHDTTDRFHQPGPHQLQTHKQYITCWHPHGAFTFCAAAFTSQMAGQGSPGCVQNSILIPSSNSLL
jgi:hypothetical protein